MTDAPTFESLCESLRAARHAHIAAIAAADAAKVALKKAEDARVEAGYAEDDARDALDRLIDTQVAL